MRHLLILGSSGSIGLQTLDVIRNNKDKFVCLGMSIGTDLELAKKNILEFKPEIVCLKKEEDISYLKDIKDIKFVFGDAGLIEVATYKKELKDTYLVSALSGFAGLIPTIEAIKIKRDIMLANKETLVVAGDIVMNLAKDNGVSIYPIDSEHSAIWQSIQGEKKDDIKRLIITASGGAFRDKDDLSMVNAKDALLHPNWLMGKKITIDCATMANKGFEVMEAHHLFGIPYDNIDVLLHKESIIHSLVEFKDSSVKAQMANPDMRMPIIYALNYPDGRLEFNNQLDLLKIKNLSFAPVDENKYPMFYLCLDVAKRGNIYPCVLNAANEVAVNLFLGGKIKFLDIYQIVKEEIEHTNPVSLVDLDTLIRVDKETRLRVLKKFGE